MNITNDEALQLHRYDRIMVKVATRSRYHLALVTGDPHQVDRWVLVPYAIVKQDGGPGRETLSRHDHVAQIPVDQIKKA